MIFLLAIAGHSTEMTGNNTLVMWYSAWGSTKRVAEAIANENGARTLEILSDVDYTGMTGLVRSIYDSFFRTNYTILTPIPDLTGYDYIFVATPVWGYRTPPHVRAFLDEIDFGGRTVIPVGTCRAEIKGFVGHTAGHLRNARLIEKEGFPGVRSMSDQQVRARIKEWLVGI
jgi:flavodoxin